MKDRWKFCQCCYLNGHCENQDRDMECEHYSKQLEDKVERLQEQLKEANETIKQYAWDSGYWESGYHYKDSSFADVYINKWKV